MMEEGGVLVVIRPAGFAEVGRGQTGKGRPGAMGSIWAFIL